MSVDFIVEVDPKDFVKFTKILENKILDVNEATAKKLGNNAIKLLKDLTKPWTHPVEFEAVTEGSKDNIAVLVGTDDKIFGFLDKGTSVRRAVMAPGFKAKTSPGSLKSGGGKGGVIFISKKISLPGIKARNFTDNVAKIIDRQAEQEFNKAAKKKRL